MYKMYTDYLLGVFEGDGFLYSSKINPTKVGLVVKDEDFADKFIKNLKKITPNIKKRAYLHNTGYKKIPMIEVVSYNKECYLAIKKLKKERKIKDIKDYLKGVFDSEGCAFYGEYKCKNRIQKVREVNACTTNLQTFKTVCDCLNSLSIEYNTYSVQQKKLLHRVCIIKQKSVKLFAKLINFSIKRKSEKLKFILNSYNGKKTKDKCGRFVWTSKRRAKRRNV